MPAKLTIQPPERAARFVIVRDGETLEVGRDPECGLVLEDPRVSKHHARLAWNGAGWQLQDLGSKNGTSVNGHPAAGQALAEGDWVSFGGVRGSFQRITEEEALRVQAERLARLETSLDLGRQLRASLDPRELLQRLLESARKVTGTERGFVLVAGEDGKLRAEVASGFALAHLVEERFAGSVGAVERALASRRPVVLSDARTDPVLGRRPSVVAMGLGTLACVPLERDGQILGLLYVDSRRSGSGFTQLDEEVLEALAYSAAVVLDTLRLDHRIPGLLRPPASGAIEEALLGELQRRLEGATRGAQGAMPGFGGPEPGFPGEG